MTVDVDAQIKIAVKTGDVSFGFNEALKAIKTGKARLVILASNPPRSFQGSIPSASAKDSTPIFHYEGASLKLGMVCGKPFAVNAVTVKKPGDSEILKLISKDDVEDTIDQ